MIGKILRRTATIAANGPGARARIAFGKSSRSHSDPRELTCNLCGHSERFDQDATVKDAMLQVDAFLSTHIGCREREE